ncbi:uncharacterized protein L3040_000621 [Drepanopeziza brunnea f. sp. 'multigermtubi']|uniref:TPA: arylamine N-acetyltransferase 1 n=1 Tax=Marssonina brunnea f. sp. multigermtubi (strain MB_m1) TaxID=1072389 RepID=K1X8G1_MARBU|nr:arylamine N-acetyltransferase 1 [Drepanopeziza brunnea f. sp. 'multigermtubi' MB_m1]EKD21342.1 arylamine N-acetyltransferase 1 [Drepanopeziza brunnea f. sp. 'multigermtubi' MB_m1]KAJ5054346.1 hypothetical protein L3040_000621 [Drepanopeziza brunnea f. sp. 'multigermtubi']
MAVLKSPAYMRSTSAYTQEQLDAWEEHVSLPTRFRRANRTAVMHLDIEYLAALHVCQISSVPYENLQLHYSTSHDVSLDPQDLFKKIVTNKRGRGGYCMENGIFFNHVLRGMGFSVYTAGVKIRPRLRGKPEGNYIGWVHMVNIVTIDHGVRWCCDVGFGGDGPTKPLHMSSGQVVQNLGAQQVRLRYGEISAYPHFMDQDRKMWMYEYRNSLEDEWNAFYAFTDLEFTAADFEVMNHYTSHSLAPTNLQTRTVLCIRFVSVPMKGNEPAPSLDEADGLVVTEKIMMVNDTVKRNDGKGKTSLITVCHSEQERIDALQRFFHITLETEERLGIRGREVEISNGEKGGLIVLEKELE